MLKLPPLRQTPTHYRIYKCKCFHSAMPNFDTVLLNKQNWCKSKFEYIWVLQHKIPPWKMKAKAAFYFLILCRQLLSWKDIVGKKVSKLRSIAELRAFYGITLTRKIKQCVWNKSEKKFWFSNICKTWGRVLIWIDIKMENQIRIGIKTMPIHNTAHIISHLPYNILFSRLSLSAKLSVAIKPTYPNCFIFFY